MDGDTQSFLLLKTPRLSKAAFQQHLLGDERNRLVSVDHLIQKFIVDSYGPEDHVQMPRLADQDHRNRRPLRKCLDNISYRNARNGRANVSALLFERLEDCLRINPFSLVLLFSGPNPILPVQWSLSPAHIGRGTATVCLYRRRWIVQERVPEFQMMSLRFGNNRECTWQEREIARTKHSNRTLLFPTLLASRPTSQSLLSIPNPLISLRYALPQMPFYTAWLSFNFRHFPISP